MRFQRQGVARPVRETIRVRLTGGDARFDVEAALPTQSIAFPARGIGMSDLAAVDREFRKSMVVRKNKSLDDPGQSMDFSPYRYRPFAYVFTASSNRARR